MLPVGSGAYGTGGTGRSQALFAVAPNLLVLQCGSPGANGRQEKARRAFLGLKGGPGVAYTGGMEEREMRFGQRELGRVASEDILRRGEYGILCTCGADGQPYGVPLSYVLLGDCIGFHCAPLGHKCDNLAQNARASFTVVGATCPLPGQFSTRYESAIAFGAVCPVEGEAKRAILRALVEKYSPGFREKGELYLERDFDKVATYALHIEQLRGKARR